MTILIKRYANRKLYNTETSRYITLKGVGELLDRGQEASLETMLNFETECLVVASIMKDHIEGVHAFHDRRDPTFKGY